MSLIDYRRKRDFRKTPEPSGKKGRRRRTGRRFVIQKHDASRLHYDFRLEFDGTLKSWAVPKGPSLDPSEKQLAVQVEDHPLPYGDFEGTIPKGEYGGGTVLIWDRGTWTPVGDAAEGFRTGKLKFDLEGEKVSGRWTLVRMSGKAGEGGKNWLLIKERDTAARALDEYDVLAEEPLSAVTGRDLPEIAEGTNGRSNGRTNGRSNGRKTAKVKTATKTTRSQGKDPLAARLSGIDGAKRARQPQTFKPQLATLGDQVPEGKQWLHEMKFDGYRVVAIIDGGDVRLMTRRGQNWTAKFSGVASAVKGLGLSQAILDGEVVVLRPDGKPDFQRLQNALKAGTNEAFVYYLFDLPHCAGYDLTGAGLTDRKAVLKDILLENDPENEGTLRYVEHIAGRGEDVVDSACRHELEGIISKRVDSSYESLRTRTWMKTKCLKRQEFVIGGFTRPQGSRPGFGALLLGYYQDGELQYAGRVGTGFTEASLRQLHPLLKEHETAQSPFANIPREATRGVQSWTEPRLVAEVAFTEWTRDRVLRHPSFKGLRDDKPAKQVSRERPMSTDESATPRPSRTAKSRRSATSELKVAGITVTNPDRVVYPESGLTKGDIARFYESIEDWILPHVIHRPLSLLRCPGGRDEECFFQKHFDIKLPEAVRKIAIQEKHKKDDYLVIDDLSGLIALVQFGMLEIHPWGSRDDDPERPDRLIFDLDPGEGATWKQVVQGAKEIHDRLSDLGLESFLRTSGGKGLHVVLPLTRHRSWDELKEFARQFAADMAADDRSNYVATMSKQQRSGRVFIDYLRNGRGATAVASYSTRARAGAPVATPLAWNELSDSLKPDQYTVRNLPDRLQSLTSDPWEEFFKIRQSITKGMLK